MWRLESLLNSAHNCEDHLDINSVNLQFKYMNEICNVQPATCQPVILDPLYKPLISSDVFRVLHVLINFKWLLELLRKF